MILPYKSWRPTLKRNAWIAEGASVIGRVEMGEDSAIWFGAVVRGDVHYIKIGDRSNIQDLSMVHVTHHKKEDMSDGNPTIIGNDVTVGHRVMLHGCTHSKMLVYRSAHECYYLYTGPCQLLASPDALLRSHASQLLL